MLLQIMTLVLCRTAGFVEQTAVRLGLKTPTISLEQMSLRQSRRMANLVSHMVCGVLLILTTNYLNPSLAIAELNHVPADNKTCYFPACSTCIHQLKGYALTLLWNYQWPLYFQGRCIGVCIGCILGMWPLLFYIKEKETVEEPESKTSESSTLN